MMNYKDILTSWLLILVLSQFALAMPEYEKDDKGGVNLRAESDYLEEFYPTKIRLTIEDSLKIHFVAAYCDGCDSTFYCVFEKHYQPRDLGRNEAREYQKQGVEHLLIPPRITTDCICPSGYSMVKCPRCNYPKCYDNEYLRTKLLHRNKQNME